MEHALDIRNLLWFAGWLIALAVLFVAALRLPLQTRLRKAGSLLYNWGVVVGAIVLVAVANAALVLHDAYLDLTREKVFTPSEQAMKVVDSLQRDVDVTYFYQGQDQNGRRMKDVLEVMGHRNAHLRVRAIDPDKQPTLAETAGVKLYNAAVIEAEGRRVMVQSTDENDIAVGILRVLRERVINICFLEGHNEFPMDNFEFHTHLEGLQGHSHGDANSAVVKMPGHGIGRLRRALEALGYDVRKVILATAGAVPADCALAIDANPRTTFLPAESAALEKYIRNGGSVLLMLDLGFVIEPHLARLLEEIGVRPEQKVVIDPLSHYSSDPEMVAVTGYDNSPITRNVSMTFYPGIRPLELIAPANGVTAAALFESSRDSYTKDVRPVEARQVPEEPRAGADRRAAPVKAGPRVLAAASTGHLPGAAPGSEAFRAIVVGDGDFASNSFLPYMSNSDLALSMVRWLVREERSPTVASRIPVPPMILLTQPQMLWIFLILEVLLPGALIVLGGVMWWKHR
ncbi:MAG TPA: GldG family protein [Burkholderiales bacterium]|nr:GldG family protein [Burkholderiales bacterium]